jgi:hypothetical protein
MGPDFAIFWPEQTLTRIGFNLRLFLRFVLDYFRGQGRQRSEDRGSAISLTALQ